MAKILFVNAVSDFRGGAEQVLVDLLSNGTVSPVLALPCPGELSNFAESRGIRVEYYYPSNLSAVRRPLNLLTAFRTVPDVVRCASRIRAIAVRNGCGIIHSNGLKTHVLTAAATRFHSLKSVLHLHDIPYTRSERLVWRGLGRAVDRVVAVSRPCWPEARLPRSVRVIPNGITVSHAPAPPPVARQRFQLGFVGRFHPHKGLTLLVDWMVDARAAGLDFELRLRGGPDPDRPWYWEDVRRRLAEHDLWDRVHLDGWRNGDAVYEGLDALVVPSDHPDPLPRVVMEGGARRLPVIATPSGGIPTMIDDGQTGFLVRDSQGFIQALRGLIANPRAGAQIGESARRKIENEFTLARFHQRFGALYRELQTGTAQP